MLDRHRFPLSTTVLRTKLSEQNCARHLPKKEKSCVFDFLDTSNLIAPRCEFDYDNERAFIEGLDRPLKGALDSC